MHRKLKSSEGNVHRASVPASTCYPNPNDRLPSASQQQEIDISEDMGKGSVASFGP